MSNQQKILAEIAAERRHQDLKWGGPSHDDGHHSHDWVAFIVRYLGRAVVWPWDAETYRRAMVKVAALAVAAIEWVDRTKGAGNGQG